MSILIIINNCPCDSEMRLTVLVREASCVIRYPKKITRVIYVMCM